MTTEEKMKVMKARYKVFQEMAEHYERLADVCFTAWGELGDQLVDESWKEFDEKMAAKIKASTIEVGIKALLSAN